MREGYHEKTIGTERKVLVGERSKKILPRLFLLPSRDFLQTAWSYVAKLACMLTFAKEASCFFLFFPHLRVYFYLFERERERERET